MSGIKNSTPAHRVTAPGEQGQVAHPHSAGSTPGPTQSAPPRRAPGAFASAPGANRGVARRRGDRVTDVYFSDGSAVHSLPPCAVRPCRMRYACVVLQFFASVSQSRTVNSFIDSFCQERKGGEKNELL